jgi:hypothetical protein
MRQVMLILSEYTDLGLRIYLGKWEIARGKLPVTQPA